MIADLRDFLNTSVNIANMIEGRIEYEYVRQNTAYPHILLRVIDDSPPLYHLGGEPDISNAAVQLDCYAKDETGPNGAYNAEKLSSYVRNRISGYRGDMGDTRIQSCTLTNSSPFDEEPEAGEQGRVHRVTMNFEIKYYRAVPDFT